MSCRRKKPNPKPRVTAEISREKRAGGEIPPSQLPPSALPFRKVFQECEHGQTHPRNEIPLLRAWVFSKLRLLWVCKREEHELHSSHPWDAPGGLLPHSLHTWELAPVLSWDSHYRANRNASSWQARNSHPMERQGQQLVAAS